MPPLDILRAVTTNAAETLGWHHRVGAVEAGKFADLIGVAGDPSLLHRAVIALRCVKK